MNILFLGNSHTYHHGMAYQCEKIMQAQGVDVRVTMIAEASKSLGWHRDFHSTRLALRYADWDHIVLQQVTHPFPGKENLLEEARDLLTMMPEGQNAWLYQTWCEKKIPSNQVILDEAFAAVSEALALPLVPVADAWCEARRRDPHRELYDADGEHAGRGGSYLAALCMARCLSGRSVMGVPSTLMHGRRMLNRVSPEAAEAYQRVVEELI